MRTLQRIFLAFCLFASVMDTSTGDDSATLAVSRGVHLFSSNFVNNVTFYGRNSIISPLSVNVALSMAANGAAGSTKQQFKEVLKLPASKLQTLEGYQNLIDKMNNVENVTLNLANKIFISKGFPVKPEYKQDLQTYYRSDIQSVDFSKSEEAANTINTWSKNETNNRIDNIVTADDLDSNTALVLANAVYFKGKWAQQFNVNDTEDRPFWIADDVLKSVPIMYRKGNYKYVELSDYDAKCIELPYANKDVSMVIILPSKRDTRYTNYLSVLINKLDEVSTECSTRLAQTSEREVHLYLPKFKTETTLDLNGVLQEMGLVLPFTDSANFTGISDVPLKISKVVQKAFIEVNEEGSEAAAVTVQRSFLAFCLFASIMDTSNGNESALLAVSGSVYRFSSYFITNVTKEQSGNLIFSPLSVDVALSMAADGAAGSTEQQFKKVLKLPASKSQTLEGYDKLIDTLNNVENVSLSLANKAYIDESFPVKSEYKQDLETYYHSDIQSIDFSSSEKAANIINTWCKDETNNRIDSIVTAGELKSSPPELLLVNAVYFKGKWAQEFNVSDTQKRPFYINANITKEVSTMYSEGQYKYAFLTDHNNEKYATCIELSYANKDISMRIILPDKIDGLAAMIDKLDEVRMECNTLLDQASKIEIILYLPKFKIESKLYLNKILQKMGLRLPFMDNANFKGISDVPLKISKVVQKAFIEVNEEGAAVTESKPHFIGGPGPVIPVISIDHPCYYEIVKVDRIQEYQSTTAFSTILFSGIIADP